MYYHVLIETNEKVGKRYENKKIYELDKQSTLEIIQSIIIPFLKKENFQFNGYFLRSNDIARIIVKETDRTTVALSKYENEHMPRGVIMYVSPEMIVGYDKYAKDITKDIFAQAKEMISTPEVPTPLTKADYKKVFVVHGRDELAKTEVARFLEKLNLEPIILHEQASQGMTIIEKIEAYSNVQFGVVIYTPCDLGALDGETELKPRARQNVVFEHGFLIGKLKRENVCALVKDDVETPNDISGIIYVPMDRTKAWTLGLAKELKRAGFPIDMNKAI